VVGEWGTLGAALGKELWKQEFWKIELSGKDVSQRKVVKEV